MFKRIFLLALLSISLFWCSNAQVRFAPQINTTIGVSSIDNVEKCMSIELIAGVRLSKYVRIGIGTGYDMNTYEVSKFEYTGGSNYIHYSGEGKVNAIPVFGDLKINIPTKKVSPFIHCNGGYDFISDCPDQIESHNGLRLSVGPGVDIKVQNLSIVIGVDYMIRDWIEGLGNAQSIGVSVGFSLN